MERAVVLFAVVQFLIVGVSHVVQPLAWVQFFTLLRDQGRAGVFVVAFLSLWFGSIIVAFHQVWSGIPAILTIVGWAQVAKGLIYFTAPSFGLRRLEFVTEKRAWGFRVAGGVLIVLGALLAYDLGTSA